MRDLLVDLVKDFALGRSRRSVRLPGTEHSKPFSGLRQRFCEIPANQHQRERRNNQSLDDGIEERIAEGVRDLYIDVTGVVQESECSDNMSVDMERQGIDV